MRTFSTHELTGASYAVPGAGIATQAWTKDMRIGTDQPFRNFSSTPELTYIGASKQTEHPEALGSEPFVGAGLVRIRPCVI
jgi:hypothetical protein